MAEKTRIICICGMAGSGKSIVARKLAEKFELKHYSGGDLLKTLASKEGYKLREHGWWESEEGMCFLSKREKDPQFDKAIDTKLTELARHGNVVLDSWTMPWLLKKGFKIWLKASINERAERVAKRDGISHEKALNALRRREEKTKNIYEKIYGFRLGEDFRPFHLILDTNQLNVEEVFHIISAVVENMISIDNTLKERQCSKQCDK